MTLLSGAARTALFLTVLLPVYACQNRPPVALSSQFSPPSRQSWPGAAAESDPAHPCPVRVTDVRDLRTDPEAMGATVGRLIRSADTAAWVRSGFMSLGQDRRLQMLEGDGPNDLAIEVDILKAYAMSVTGETRAANVVLRLHYSRYGAPSGEQIYRGTENGVNWANGEGETQSSFDDALADLLKAVDRDLVTRCASNAK